MVSFLVVLGNGAQVTEKSFWCQNVRRSDNHFPVLVRVGDFVSAAHLGVAHAAHDEDNQSGDVADDGLRFVLVPVAVSCAGRNAVAGLGGAVR